MRPIVAALLLGALSAITAESIAAPKRPGDAPQAGQLADRPAAVRSGESAAVAALLDSVDRELAAGRPEPALALLERALRIEPRNAALWHYLGLANLALGNHSQAEAMAAKAHSLVGGNRTLRARNAELTAAALRAQGKPVPPARRDWPSFEWGTSPDTQIEPAAAYVDTRDRSERRNRAEQARAPRWIEEAPRAAARMLGVTEAARGDTATERNRRARVEPRGECWIAVPNHPARRQPPTRRCDALNGQPPRAASSSTSPQRSASRAERRSHRRYGTNGYQL